MQKMSEARFVRPGTTLPPGLQGPTKGEVLLLFRWTGAVRNSVSGHSSRQTAQVLWWGEPSPGSSLQLVPNAERGLIYTVTCGPKAVTRYLTDMQQLEVSVTVDLGNEMHTAQRRINLSQLQSNVQLVERIAITAANGRLLGTAALAISLSHTPLSSSFEVNEHLASTDFSMPLYPTTSSLITPLRQLHIQPNSDTGLLANSQHSAGLTQPVSPSFKHPVIKSCAVSPAKQTSDQCPELSHVLQELARYMHEGGNIGK